MSSPPVNPGVSLLLLLRTSQPLRKKSVKSKMKGREDGEGGGNMTTTKQIFVLEKREMPKAG